MSHSIGSYLASLSTRGAKFGVCNICGEAGPLTEDHTPPKSCRGISNAEMHSLTVRIAGDNGMPARRLRNGPSYRTLCGRCNNSLLGADYDPALAEFCAAVRDAVNTKVLLPQSLSVEVQPQPIMRSVLGHLCALGVNRYAKGAITEPLRDYLLDRAQPLPEQIRVYYWLYPFRPQVLIRDACLLLMGSDSDPFLFWLMKFFPLAFLVTFEEPAQRPFEMANLDRFGSRPFDFRSSVPVRLRPHIHELWPEAPTDRTVILYGEQAVGITPREK